MIFRFAPLVVSGLLLALFVSPPAGAIETAAKQVIVVDVATGTVMLEKNADELMAPASMTKIMTANLVFDRLNDGRLSLQDTLPVSENAWRKGGSKMFVRVGNEVAVGDLLRGIIIQSGNDASIVIAEALGGSESAFGDLMTEKAREIGMTETTFRNATGWPDPEHLTTARDMARLAAYTVQTYPEFYHLYGEKSFTYNKIKQGNRNPLLYKDLGADGLKTGHTELSGYGLTASVKRGDRRIVLVINGLTSVNERSGEAQRLITWAYREFANYELFKPGEEIEKAAVWMGQNADVGLVLGGALTLTVPRAGRREMEVKVVVDEPVPAPIKAGDRIAKLVITAPDMVPAERPLFAATDVAELDFVGRVGASLKHFIFGAAESVRASAQ